MEINGSDRFFPTLHQAVVAPLLATSKFVGVRSNALFGTYPVLRFQIYPFWIITNSVVWHSMEDSRTD